MTLNANYRASLILQLDKIFMFRGKKFLPITDSLKLYDRVSKDTWTFFKAFSRTCLVNPIPSRVCVLGGGGGDEGESACADFSQRDLS